MSGQTKIAEARHQKVFDVRVGRSSERPRSRSAREFLLRKNTVLARLREAVENFLVASLTNLLLLTKIFFPVKLKTVLFQPEEHIVDKAQIKRLTVRWSLLTSGAIALFWIIYAAIYGEVPTVPIWTNDLWTLWPLRAVPAPAINISRWFDVLLGVTLVPIAILSFCLSVPPANQPKREEPDPEANAEDDKPSDFDILRFTLCLAVDIPVVLGLFYAAEGGLPAGIIVTIIGLLGAAIVLTLTALCGICMVSLGHALVFTVRRLVTERTYYKRLTASSTTKWFGGK